MTIAFILALDLVVTVLAANIVGPAAFRFSHYGLPGLLFRTPFYLLRFYIGIAAILLRRQPNWSYVRNNPLALNDPSGLCIVNCGEGGDPGNHLSGAGSVDTTGLIFDHVTIRQEIDEAKAGLDHLRSPFSWIRDINGGLAGVIPTEYLVFDGSLPMGDMDMGAVGDAFIGPNGLLTDVASIGQSLDQSLQLGAGGVVQQAAEDGSDNPAANLVGATFGKLGTVVENPSTPITGFSKHAIDNIINRSVSPQAIFNTVENPGAVLVQSGGQHLYLSGQAGVVVSPTGNVITAYPSSMFDEEVKGILELFEIDIIP